MTRRCAKSVLSAIGLVAASALAPTFPAMAQVSDDDYEFCQAYWQNAFDSFEDCLDAVGQVQPNDPPPSSEPPDPGTGGIDPMNPNINPCMGRLDCG